METAWATKKSGMSLGTMATKPRMPAEPSDMERRSKRLTRAEPKAEPIMPQKNAQRIRRLTPKMAGSVIPKKAEAEAAPARPLIFWFFTKRKIASAAAA